ncbi:titin-like [Penaeus chinensis]|uniref:titin-like n=1 Tax=Penaeus chinensis TaxID=139456 RepID=UPI001FB719F5|nr:titin-like [Penaeus chinensis]
MEYPRFQFRQLKPKQKRKSPKRLERLSQKSCPKLQKAEGSQRNSSKIAMSDDEEKCQTSIKDERGDEEKCQTRIKDERDDEEKCQTRIKDEIDAPETKPPTETAEDGDNNVRQKNVKVKAPKPKKVRRKQKISSQNIVVKDKLEQVTNKVAEIPVEKNTEESQIKSEIVETKNKKNVPAVEVSSMENGERVKIETAEAEEPPRKRRRKKVDYTVDSDNEDVIDHKTSHKINPEETGDKEYTITDADTENSSKKVNISTFFKKISKEEKAAERSKNIFTVKADVHAPCDGMLESSKMEHAAKRKKIQGNETADKENVSDIPKDKKNDRRISRRIMKRQELEELNKIELLEQITPTNSPVKLPAQNLREINITSNDLPKKERGTGTITEAAAVESKTFETKNNVAKKIRNKASKRILQEEENDCTKIEESKNGDEAKIPLEDLPVNEENTEKKEPAKKSRRRLSRKTVSEPPDTLDQTILPKENTLPKAIVESIETPSSELDATDDEIFPKSTRATRTRSLNKSAQDSNTDTDTSIGSRKRSPRTRNSPLLGSVESEDDKENVVHYTSTLIQKPGKLSLRLKKVQPTLKTKTKGRKSLSLKHNNVAESCPAQAKARELVQKAKLAKRSP